ncbi:MAG TPA: transglutaminase-like domain-containing protein [Sphingomonas sp.]|jgi:regulator of sirC expression with transglutaminase-like and TPR domain|nr:transglutaminase-like domain-containing protein [Sphingomonas sp.]
MEEDIARFGLLEDDAIALDASALEIAALDHPDVPLEPYVALLTRVTERLVDIGSDAHSAGERAYALVEVIGGEHGFVGDRDTYDDPANADMIRVIDRRRGLPVSLAMLYVAAARRMGWSADVLNTPGHVLARIGSETEPVLVDAFAGGDIVDANRLSDLLARMLGPDATPSKEHLAPMTNRGVLIRLLMNQATRAEARGSRERALTLFRRMTLIAPSNAHAWWERARLERASGDVASARASLSAMLEVTRDPALRSHIFGALDAMTG